uniref:Uncharacterized protein LOC111114263 n=1 Tax=Crassostrea virginica TaxID=6565 RepID=A0A8B8BY75_CRAVI|nr:uncharacterized protein LOC111114263 [Crassostrea virginica]
MMDIAGRQTSGPSVGKFPAFLAGLIVFIIPCVHIGIVNKKIWVPNKTPVNKTTCRCNCFDTVYKGSYERPGKTGYKHIYFNATLETMVIWTLTLFTIIIAYEAFKRLFNLYSAGNVRWRMLVLFVLDIYPNYYSYWSYFNYTNDGFYAQVYHQLFFTTTELFSTWNVFWLCSKDFPMTSGPVMVIVTISLIHILLGGVDQFFVQLILWQEHTFQKARNIGFVIPDILHIILTLQEIAKERKTSWKQSFTGNELKYGFIFVISGFILGKIIFR